MSVSKELVDIIKGSEDKGTKPYDTPATVTRVDGSTVWVHIPGGVDETPVKKTINAKAGDTVQVRVSGGSAWLNGNASAPPTDDTQANLAVEYALVAGNAADSAVKSANIASEAAEDAKATADSVHGIATQALADAATAKGAADNASEYAARAFGNLSTVQSITETLNWITQHGTMTLTSDVALDPTHVYFVVDAGGDYVVNGVTYAIVTEPDVDDIGNYYELSIDESLNNYVGTHLALTSEGLWLLPASSGTNKVLIATGAGTQYTTAGTYIIDDANHTVAMFGESAIIGINDGTQSYLYEDYHSLQMVDKEGNAYFHVSDLRDINGELAYIDVYTGDGSAVYFVLTLDATDTNYSVVLTNDTSGAVVTKKTVTFVRFSVPPSDGSTITISYTTADIRAKAYTLGLRKSGEYVAPMSYAEGYDVVASEVHSHAEGFKTVASGYESHAEGSEAVASGNQSHAEGAITTASGASSHAEGASTTASGQDSHAEGGFGTEAVGMTSHAEGSGTLAWGSSSHAEGDGTEARGQRSHAQNLNTHAYSDNQTALGKYNIDDSANTYAVIIGNGTGENSRSNALTVDWAGNVVASGGLTLNGTDAVVDYIVEQGTSGIWTYRKWNSGISECWGFYNFESYAISTARGSLYSGGWKTVNFPTSLFTTSPCVRASDVLDTTFYCVFLQTQSVLAASMSIRLVSSGSMTANSYNHTHIHATGRWK